LNLPSELIRQAKVYAAEHDMTINALVRALLEEAVTQASRRRASVRRVLEIARQKPSSNVDPASFSREEIHERW
jgi:plasmid stability protein